jgi:hypothetical protein
MMIERRRLRAAFLYAVLCGAAVLPDEAAQAQSIEVPAYRQLGADEVMAAPGGSGSDYSANAPSLSGLTLLATVPAPVGPRRGYFIQAQCTAGLAVVFDDPAGALTPSVMVLAGAAANGGQGGSVSMAGMPHTGRIRIYSSASGCQMAARAW